MTDFESFDLLDLAEDVAAGRLSMTEAEARIRSRSGSRRFDKELAELRALVGSLGAIRSHARATREVGGTVSSAPAPFGDVSAVAVDGSVRRRRSARSGGYGTQRPLLAFAAVLLLGAGLATASFIGARLNSPPTPSSFPPVALASPSPTASEPGPVASASVPTASSAPSVAPSQKPRPSTSKAYLWSLSDPKHITVSIAQIGSVRTDTLLSIDTWPDPDRAAGSVIYRQVLASPRGRYMAIAETDPNARTRLRVTTIKGQVVWSNESSNGIPALAWSADGAQLAIAFVPEPWLVVKMGGLDASAHQYRLPSGSAYKLLGFSADAQSLLGYESSGEAAPWEQPIAVDVGSGDVSRLQAYPPIAASNTTTDAPLVDPVTGRVLDAGGAAGTETNWGMYRGQRRTDLELALTSERAIIEPRWSETGSILVLETPTDSKPPSNNQRDPVLLIIRDPAPGARPAKIADASWAFMGPKGTRSRGRLLEARAGHVLIGLATYPSDDEPWMGCDEVNLIDLETGAMLVLSFDGLGAFDIHSAGLVD